MTPRDDESYESREELRRDLLADQDFRQAYAESFLNTFVAAQIKALREMRGMTQADLAEAIGTKQAGVSRLENVNYSAWKTETLRKIARALKVRLRISFETFGTLIDEVKAFSRESLQRVEPQSDPKLTLGKRRESLYDFAAFDRPIKQPTVSRGANAISMEWRPEFHYSVNGTATDSEPECIDTDVQPQGHLLASRGQPMRIEVRGAPR